MRGVYEAIVTIAGEVGLAAPGHTLIYITTPATCAVEILSARITGSGTNVTNQQLLGELRTVTTLGTPSATTLTPTKNESGSASAASTVKGNVTASEPTYTANTSIGKAGFSSLGGWYYQPVPEERMTIPPSTTIGLLLVGVATAFDCQASITFREIG